MSYDGVDEDVPRAFVDWSVMSSLLSQATTGGVKAAILMKTDGSPLSVSAAVQPSSTEKIVGALVSNIWKSIENSAKSGLEAENLGLIMVECEEGSVCVSRISRFLLVLYSDKSSQMGEIKLKMDALNKQLQPLIKVY